MVIGIDASRAVKSHRTGTENYSLEIIRALLALKTDHRFILYSPVRSHEAWANNPAINWRLVPAGRLWSQQSLYKALKHSAPDVLFVPSHVIPLLTKVPSVVTIHDLSYFVNPDSYSWPERNYLIFSTAASISKARRVIVPSRYTEQAIVSRYPEAKNKTQIVPHGLDHVFYDSKLAIEQPPIVGPYIFCLGRIESKKNLRVLIKAFSQLGKQHTSLKLVLAGKAGWGWALISQQIASLPTSLASRIIITGYLPNYDARRYLKHANVFAMPGADEGFGLPVLEAMALGVPVIASRAGALPEIVGKAGLLADPSNIEDWVKQIDRLLTDKELSKELVKLGLARASSFTWQKAAEQTLAVLEESVA